MSCLGITEILWEEPNFVRLKRCLNPTAFLILTAYCSRHWWALWFTKWKQMSPNPYLGNLAVFFGSNKPRPMTSEPSACTHVLSLDQKQLASWLASQTDAQVEVAPLSSQLRIKGWKKTVRTWLGGVGQHKDLRTQNTQTFDSWQVNACMLMNPNAVADNPKRALFEGTWTCHQLKDKQGQRKTFKLLHDC